jgi:hypothetical protein
MTRHRWKDDFSDHVERFGNFECEIAAFSRSSVPAPYYHGVYRSSTAPFNEISSTSGFSISYITLNSGDVSRYEFPLSS